MEKLEALVSDFVKAKAAENKAKNDRIFLEEEIAKLVEGGENSSKTVEAGNMKVTVKRELNYKANVEGLRGLGIEGLPLKPTPPVPAGYEFDKKAYEELISSNRIDILSKIAEFVEVKPKKTSVAVKIA